MLTVLYYPVDSLYVLLLVLPQQGDPMATLRGFVAQVCKVDPFTVIELNGAVPRGFDPHPIGNETRRRGITLSTFRNTANSTHTYTIVVPSTDSSMSAEQYVSDAYLSLLSDIRSADDTVKNWMAQADMAAEHY